MVAGPHLAHGVSNDWRHCSCYCWAAEEAAPQGAAQHAEALLISEVVTRLHACMYVATTLKFRVPGLNPYHRWAIAPKYIEKFRIVLPIFKVSAPPNLRDRQSLTHTQHGGVTSPDEDTGALHSQSALPAIS